MLPHEVPTVEVDQIPSGALVLDVREDDEWAAGHAPGAIHIPMGDIPARLDEVPQLLGFTNYPWNKVIRTDHYHRTGLRFGATQVHNDILGHWLTLVDADQVLKQVLATVPMPEVDLHRAEALR